MPSVVAVLALVGLIKISHLGLPAWHLAFWFAVLVSVALSPMLGWGSLVLNAAGSFAASWAYFGLLERLDNVQDRALHWLWLLGGLLLLVASRLALDLLHYGIAF